MDSPGISIDTKVSSFLYNGQWVWPFPLCLTPLSSLIAPKMTSFNGLVPLHNAAATRDSIRGHSSIVHWHHLLWFPNCIPRHLILIRMAIKGGLRTKEKPMNWGIFSSPIWSLCSKPMNWGTCLYFAKAQRLVLSLVIPSIRPLIRNFKGIVILVVVVRKIAWAAIIYYIWQERNHRIFQGIQIPPSAVFQDQL